MIYCMNWEKLAKTQSAQESWKNLIASSSTSEHALTARDQASLGYGHESWILFTFMNGLNRVPAESRLGFSHEWDIAR